MIVKDISVEGTDQILQSHPSPRLALSSALSQTQTNIKSMECLQFSTPRYVLLIFISIPLLFFPYLLYKWFLCFRLLVFRTCSFTEATHILVRTLDFSWEICPVIRCILPDSSEFLWWDFRCGRYYLNQLTGKVQEVGFDSRKTFSELHTSHTVNYGLTAREHEKAKLMHGENKIHVSFQFLWKMLENELLNPFYIFQALSVAFWFYEGYSIYAFIVILLTLLSTGTSFIDMLSIVKSIRKDNEVMPPVLAKLSDVPDYVLIENRSVVPGMKCKLVRPQKIGFDCIVVSGKCYVKETAVTGDTLLKQKRPLPTSSDSSSMYDILQHREHTIYAGSIVEDVGGEVCEVLVINTGFSTVQGRLIRNMLYPQKDKYVQYEDAVWFAGFLAVICIGGFCICVPTFMSQKLTLRVLIENFFDLITIAVPPILPAAMSIGTSIAVQRLHSAGIYCVSPAKVAIAGKVTAICIDARGTLVEEDQAFVGYRLVRVPVSQVESNLLPMFGKYNNRTETISTYLSIDRNTSNTSKAYKASFAHALATCHSLILHKGEIIGTREDSELFASTGATLFEGENHLLQISSAGGDIVATQIRKHFNERKGILSVVVKYEKECWVYARARTATLGGIGNSNVMPSYWKEMMGNYEKNGHLVLGICAKRIDEKEAQEDWSQLLKNMDVVGIVLLKLVVKEGAVRMVQSLKKAKLPCIMFSSENSTIAVAIAKSVGLIEPRETIMFSKPSQSPEEESDVQWVRMETTENFEKQPNAALEAIDIYLGQHDVSMANCELMNGDQLLQEDLRDSAIICDKEATKFVLAQRVPAHSLKLMKQTRVFAGLNKDGLSVQLVNRLSYCGESVMAVGSPYSEYGALSKSDVGVLLSPAKQLCVFAALTCSKNDAMDVPLIISEGRAGLVTSYECFKWMAMSSIIQFATTTILYYYSLIMTDEQYLYTDLVLVLPLAFTMSWSRPRKELTADQPQSSLLSAAVLASVTGQMIIQILGQVIIFVMLSGVEGSCLLSRDELDGDEDCLETTGLFLFANIQYLATVLTYTRGDAFRETIYKNAWFMINVVLGLVLSYFLILSDETNSFSQWLGMVNVPEETKTKLLMGSIINLAVTYVFELSIKGLTKLCGRNDR